MYRINNTTHLNRWGQNNRTLRNRLFNFWFVTYAFILICLISVVSCSNISDSAASGGGTTSGSEVIICTGNVSTTGAVPDNVADILSSALASTSAASSANLSNSGGLISAAGPTVENTYTYFAEATYEGLTTPVTGSFNDTTHPTTFEIALAAGKTWTVTCGIKNAAGDIVLSDSYPDFTPTPANSVMSHTFMLQYNSSGTGSISLVMTADSVITRVMATWYCLFSEN